MWLSNEKKKRSLKKKKINLSLHNFSSVDNRNYKNDIKIITAGLLEENDFYIEKIMISILEGVGFTTTQFL